MIIFLNGSINSGKSTVAKLLIKGLSNCALLEIDVFHEMIVKRENGVRGKRGQEPFTRSRLFQERLIIFDL